MSSPARLSALGVCLGLALVGLVETRTTVFSAASEESNAETRCGSIATPDLTHVSLRGLVALRASLLPVIEPLGGRRYAWGTITPDDVWSDAPPQSLRSSRLAGGLWPASYEIREWAPHGEDIASDVFLFANPGQAHSFFDDAASPHCHRAGIVKMASRPPRARNLIWTNPDGPVEEDVFVLRGSRVYRIVDVRAQRTSALSSSTEQSAGILTVNTLACSLPDAGCSAANIGPKTTKP